MPRYGGKMRYYKDCPVLNMGYSDIAALVLVGFKENESAGAVSELLKFGSDGSYKAYIVPEDTAIPEHYKKITTFNKWLKVYDDGQRIIEFRAKKINIYRAGNFGMIVQLIESENEEV